MNLLLLLAAIALTADKEPARPPDRSSPRTAASRHSRPRTVPVQKAESVDGSPPMTRIESRPARPLPDSSLVKRILERVEGGAIALVNRERDARLIRQLLPPDTAAPCDLDDAASAGILTEPLLRTLDTLSALSSREKPLVITSLYRPLSAGRPKEPHGHGLAVDIAAFGGFRFASANAEECAAAARALIQALGPGTYRLGLPIPSGCEPVPFMPPPDRRADWPFFPPPLADVDPVLGLVGSAAPLLWTRERYAPLAEIQDAGIREAIESARARGANIHSLFPDGYNHLHLDVKPTP